MSKNVDVKENLLEAFPYALLQDSDKGALADVVAEELVKLLKSIDSITVYPRINELDEPLLDILAADFKVDWYDYEGTLEEKRKTIRECIYIHRYKGTKYAVETALKSVYDNVKVSEWFEYDGEPYHFRVTIYDSTNDAEKRSRILEKIKYYKNLRSVLDDIVFVLGVETKLPLNISIKAGAIYKKIGSEVKTYGLE